MSSRSKLFIKYILLLLFYCLTLRLIFLAAFFTEAQTKSLTDLFQAFLLGVRFDLRLASILGLPILIWLWLKQYHIFFWVSFILLEAFTFVYCVDFLHFQYVKSRVNSSILASTGSGTTETAIEMVLETYPLFKIFLLFLIISLVHYFFIKKVFYNRKFKALKIKKSLLAGFFTFFIWIFSIYGSTKAYPLRWSQAFFHTDPFISHFSLNPILYFFNSLKFKEKKYALEKVKKYYPYMKDYLQISGDNLSYKRNMKTPSLENQPNVVVIILESLAFQKTSLDSIPLNTTPYLKQLSEESLYFPNTYSPTESTARGIFATLTGIPDMSRNKSSSRNPLVVDQHTVMNTYKGYDKFYFLGGSANWGNIRGIFTNNVKDIQVYEEHRFKSSRVDVWGISDFDLFRESLDIFKKQKKPFVAILQTSGFHRPYTIPSHVKDFEPKLASPKILKDSNFFSLEQYNSMRFQDFSLKFFIEEFKKLPQFKNTVFAITGDHGLVNRNPKLSNTGLRHFNLFVNHIPMMFYAPGIIGPKKIDSSASQLDLFPTLAHFSNSNYSYSALGKNLMDPAYKDNSYAFKYNWHRATPEFYLLKDDLIYHYDDGKEGLYQFRSKDYKKDVSKNRQKAFDKMKSLAHGFYHSGRYLRYHNQKIQ